MKSPGIVILLSEVIDAIIVILTIVIIGLVLTAISGVLADIMMESLTTDIITMPNFGMDDGGGEVYDVYLQFQWISYILLAGGVVLSVAAHFARGGTMFWRTKIRDVIIAILVIATFPWLWDVGAGAMEDLTSIMLNPIYSLDEDAPCPESWTDRQIIDNYNNSPYLHGKTTGSVGHASDSCLPSWRVNYLIGQLSDDLKYTTGIEKLLNESIADPLEWFRLNVIEFVSDAITGLAMDTVFPVVQALVTIQFALMALVVIVLVDLLIMMVIAAFPILVTIRLFPLFKKHADRLLDSLPALLVLPLLSGVILYIGAGAVASTDIFSGSELYIGPISMAALYAWFASLAVIFLAVTLPLTMVPLLKNVFQAVNSAVNSAVQAATVMTSMAAKGTISKIAGGAGGAGKSAKGMGGKSGNSGEGEK